MPYKDPEKRREASRRWKEKNKAYYDEYYQTNKELIKEKVRLWVEENRDKRNATQARYRENNTRRLMFNDAKRRSNKTGLDFNIEESDIIIPDTCPVLGVAFDKRSGVGYKAAAPSLDKTIPNLGYTKGNVQVISRKANAMKQDATPEELRMFARWVLKTFPEESDGKA